MADSPPAGDETRFTVGYRRSALAPPGVLALILPLATAYAGFLALGVGAVLAAVAFTVFGLVTLVLVPLYLRAVVRALRGAPLLTFDADGVTLHSARVTLPWSNVAQIRIDHTPGRADMIVFVPEDPDRAVEGLRGLPRRFARDGIRRVGGPIFVRAAQLASPVEEILAAVRRSTSAPVRHHRTLGRTPARLPR
jgi:hypothetical protein